MTDELVKVWAQSPLVVAARTEMPAAAVAAELALRWPPERFVAVLALAGADALGPVLTGLAPVVEELLFVSDPDLGVDGGALATTALEWHGIGQDFAFVADSVPAALDIAASAFAPGSGWGWEGTAVLVFGSAAALAEGRRHLQR